ncbi:MAG: cation-translocating P-type ATPase [Deltaproteobacteria bacterium]|nr:cation-translocating P-type ATPase [Deltaproteobacteria bacterium]
MHDDFHSHPEWPELIRIGLVGVAILAVWFHWFEPFTQFSLVGVVATLLGGYPIFQEAFSSLKKKQMTMELSMTIALVAALGIGEFVTALVIVFFVLIAEVLEHKTVGKGRAAIQSLLDYLPQQAVVARGGHISEIRAVELLIGDGVVIKPGSRIPVDGVVTSGHSFVDQSTVTGESLPVEKVTGTKVFAGTMNQSGVLEVQATGIGEDTAFGKIIQAVECAEKLRAPIQKIADRLASYLVYFALGCAALTYFLTRDVRATISVIIVMGACGVAAGTPLAILGAIGLAARQGAIIKGGIYLEALNAVDTIVLDKTGTLTLGAPEVIHVVPCSGYDSQTVLQTAAMVEHFSEHPLAKAIVGKTTGTLNERPERFHYIPGKGILCELQGQKVLVGSRALCVDHGVDLVGLSFPPGHLTEVLVARGGHLLGGIHMADVLRPEATTAVSQMKHMGFAVALLTGDQVNIAEGIARQLGVDEVSAELLPEEKLNWVKSRMEVGKKVAMLGDGINDAPALMQANVGIAMGSGADIARESAHVILLGNDLLKFVDTLKIAKRCYRIIMTNFVGTLLVDGVGVVLAALGFLNPILAALIHVSSELVFILNSARLLPSLSRGSSKDFRTFQQKPSKV